MINAKTHFNSLDTLRFFSFLLVFLNHVPKLDHKWFHYFDKSGGIGVVFFFVLSGFLISYILFNEKLKSGSINCKRFLSRRGLRILPLYYAMLLFAFSTPYILNMLNLSSSDLGYEPNWLASILFLENLQMTLHKSAANVSPLGVMWSLCIEIQFYILWALLIKLTPLKKIIHLIICTIFTAIISRAILFQYNIISYDLLSNLDYFAYGAIAAYILIFNEKFNTIFHSFFHKFRFLIFASTICLIFIIPNIDSLFIVHSSPTLFGILFTAIILYSTKPSKLNKNKIWNLCTKLGTYTYGLYLIHTIIINLLIRLNQLPYAQFNWFAISFTAFCISLLISVISYHHFEIHFLKLKKYS